MLMGHLLLLLLYLTPERLLLLHRSVWCVGCACCCCAWLGLGLG